MTRTWRTALLVGILGLAAVLTVLLTHRSRSRTNLLKYKAQLRARGEKLTLAELTQSRSTQFNNGLQLLTNAVKKLAWGGLSPGLLQTRNFVGPGQALPAWELPLPSAAMSGTQATWENFSVQLEANAAVIAELREVLKNPPVDAGPRTNFFHQPVNDFVAIRTVAQWLMADASNELRLGLRDKALDDLVALGGLARMNSGELNLVGQMIRTAVTGLGIAVTWDALQSPGWTEPELERLQKAWEPVDLRDGLERAFLGERAYSDEFFNDIQGFSRTRRLMGMPSSSSISDFAADHIVLPAYKMTVAADDEMLHLRSMQDTIDALRDMKQNGSWKQAATTLNATVAKIGKIGASPQGFMFWFSRIAIPNTVKAVNTGIRIETDRQLLLAAIAIKRFQFRHGQLPMSLNDLAPEFLDKVPRDYMSTGPLSYRVAPEGFLLYSAGEDGRDDGGSAAPRAGNRFGLWEGRDAVWPSNPSKNAKANKGVPRVPLQ